MFHLLKQKITVCEESWEFQTVFQSVEKRPSFLCSRNSKLSQVLAVVESYAQISCRQGSFQIVLDTKLASPETVGSPEVSVHHGKLGSRGGNEGKRRADEFY